MRQILPLFLVVLVTLETYSHVKGVKEWDMKSASLIYFVSGILIAILPLIKRGKASLIQKKISQWFKPSFILVSFVFMVGLVLYSFHWAGDIFARFSIEKSADMLPVIKIMCERFINGEMVYKIIPYGTDIEPIYLPAMWLPFLPFSHFQIDMRWASMLFLLIGTLFIFFIKKKGNFSLKTVLVFIPLYYLFDGLFHTDFRLISLSEEPVVVGYYLFLAYALAKKYPYLIGLALSLCMMSRFSLAFWSIMYLVYVFLFQNKKDALKIGLTTFSICIILLFGTGAFWQLDVILGLPKIYAEHMIAHKWKFESIASTNLGLVKFFPYKSIPLFQQLFFIVNVSIPILSLLFYWRFKESINKPFFALCSLKLSLVFFYNFLIMPFLYLFYTSTFLSIAILSWYLKDDL